MPMSRASIRRREAFTDHACGVVFAGEYSFIAEIYRDFRSFQTGGADPIRSREGFRTAQEARDYLRPCCKNIIGEH